MDLITALLNGYDVSSKQGLVDNHGDKTILLPLYHTNLKSNGNNIIKVHLNTDGSLLNAKFVPKDDFIIFPVTNESIARSGKNPPSHPLVDKINYLVPLGGKSYETYQETFTDWYENTKDANVKHYLITIKKFLANENLLLKIISDIYKNTKYKLDNFDLEYIETNSKGKESVKKLDLSKVYITYVVNDFIGYRNVGVSDYVELHNDYIKFVESKADKLGVCNISGEEQQLTTKHRGLLGNAKLISVSNNKETYEGRFNDGTDIIQVGYRTSEKIHIMLKYLLENQNSRKWLGGQQYLINWFSDDISNQSQLDVVAPINPLLALIELVDENEASQAIVSMQNKKIGSSFIKGSKQFNDDSNYYVAIIDKASNGRISLKFFRQLSASRLMDNLNRWEDNYKWEKYQTKLGLMIDATPTMNQIILASYGIERDGKLVLDNDNFQKDQYQKLIISLLDGKNIPKNIVKALDMNIRKRLSYKRTWNQIQFVALAILNNINGEELKPMVDRDNYDRSYLFGRLLAVFERIEASTYSTKGSEKEVRITNAQKFWTSYSNKPATMMQILIDKTSHYDNQLRIKKPGLYIKLQKEKTEIINAINEHHLSSKNLNKSLDYHFIFGYYAELQFIFTKSEKTESEE